MPLTLAKLNASTKLEFVSMQEFQTVLEKLSRPQFYHIIFRPNGTRLDVLFNVLRFAGKRFQIIQSELLFAVSLCNILPSPFESRGIASAEILVPE